MQRVRFMSLSDKTFKSTSGELAASGALICRVCGSRVALSEGLARNIIVKACEAQEA